MKHKSITIPLLFSFCVLLSGCAGTTAQSCPMNPRGGLSWPIEPVLTLTILEPSRSYVWAPVYLADTLGYYEDEGLDVTFRPTGEADSGEDALLLTDLVTAMEADGQKIILTTTQQGSAQWLHDLLPSESAMEPEMTWYESFVVAASSDFIQNDPERIQKASNAFVRAMEWMEGAEPEEIAALLAPMFPGEEDALLTAAKQDKQYGVSNTTGRHTGKLYKQAADAAREAGLAGEVPSEGELYDESFLNQARDLLNASQLCRKHGAA